MQITKALYMNDLIYEFLLFVCQQKENIVCLLLEKMVINKLYFVCDLMKLNNIFCP